MSTDGWATQEHLIDVAGAALHEHGVERFSLREVARRAGVSAAAVYRHFADKEALFRAVAESSFQSLLLDLVSATSQKTRRARLDAAADAVLRFALKHPAEHAALLATTRTDEALHLLADRARECTKPSEARALAVALWAHAYGVAALKRAGRLRDVGEFEHFWRQSVDRLVAAYAK